MFGVNVAASMMHDCLYMLHHSLIILCSIKLDAGLLFMYIT